VSKPYQDALDPSSLASGATIRRKSGNKQRVYGVDSTWLRNRRSVWSIATHPFPGAHFATSPPALVEPCILAGCPAGGCVLDPFSGAGTVGMVALRHGRNFVGVEINPEYVEMARSRIDSDAPLLNRAAEVLR